MFFQIEVDILKAIVFALLQSRNNLKVLYGFWEKITVQTPLILLALIDLKKQYFKI